MVRNILVTKTKEPEVLMSSKLAAHIMKYSSELQKLPDAKVLKVVQKFQKRSGTPDSRVQQILARRQPEGSGIVVSDRCR